MMRIPMLKPKELVRALEKIGFEAIRQTGSHLVMGNRKTGKMTTIPMHCGDLKRGLVQGVIKQTGLKPKSS